MKNYYHKVKGFKDLHRIELQHDVGLETIALVLTNAPDEVNAVFATALKNWKNVFWTRGEHILISLMDVAELLKTNTPELQNQRACTAHQKRHDVQSMLWEDKIMAYLFRTLPNFDEYPLIKVIFKY